jgi:dihydrofolate reductase
MEYSSSLLAQADVLLLGRATYEGLSAAYTAMSPNAFVDRMNAIPKYVASRTLPEARWNATLIKSDVASFVTDLKQENGGSILRYGNGALTRTLMERDLIDEFHFLLTPRAVGKGKHLFGEIDDAPQLLLVDAKRFKNGVMRLIYAPGSPSASRSFLHVEK